MSEERLPHEEEEQDSTPADGSESQDTSASKDDEIAELKKEVQRLSKGFAKAFSEKGQEKKEEKETEEGGKQETNPVIRSLYFKANPEAELIWDDVEKEANALGKDPFELYESSSYLKGEAKLKAEAKKEKDENGEKVSDPSQKIEGKKKSSIKLTPQDRAFMKQHGITEEDIIKSKSNG